MFHKHAAFLQLQIHGWISKLLPLDNENVKSCNNHANTRTSFCGGHCQEAREFLWRAWPECPASEQNDPVMARAYNRPPRKPRHLLQPRHCKCIAFCRCISCRAVGDTIRTGGSDNARRGVEA